MKTSRLICLVLMLTALIVSCDPGLAPEPGPAPEPKLYKLIIDFRVTGGIGMTIDYRVGAGEEVSLYVADTHYSHVEMIVDGTVIYARNLPDPITGNAGIMVSIDGILLGGGNCPGEALWDGHFSAEYLFGG